ncbi:hypothetical protein AB4Z54_17140 [Streptomyces sp. MCAF7]
MDKPVGMFDRDFEWEELVRFASYAGAEATLGVVSGRRRQGKTFLLDGLCRAAGGFFFAASALRRCGAGPVWNWWCRPWTSVRPPASGS